MKGNEYSFYCAQLEDALAEFPNFCIVEKDGIKFLKGILDIPNDKNEIVASYLIEIRYALGFPFRFPHLFEVGGAIENDINWHKYSDNRCCITVLSDEILKCKSGITVSEFIRNYCYSFLGNHLYRKINGKYLNGEYSHGVAGIMEFYTKLFNSSDTTIWLKYFDHVFKVNQFPTERNKSCFCGSGKKFKQCHKIIFDTIWDIGDEQILNDFKLFPQ